MRAPWNEVYSPPLFYRVSGSFVALMFVLIGGGVVFGKMASPSQRLKALQDELRGAGAAAAAGAAGRPAGAAVGPGFSPGFGRVPGVFPIMGLRPAGRHGQRLRTIAAGTPRVPGFPRVIRVVVRPLPAGTHIGLRGRERGQGEGKGSGLIDWPNWRKQ